MKRKEVASLIAARSAAGLHRRPARRNGTSVPPLNPQWAFFFDIDGTLIDFADTPEEVRVDQELKEQLIQLHEATGGAVAFVSGRSIEDIDRLFPGLPLSMAGLHGMERRNDSHDIVRHGSPFPDDPEIRQYLIDAVKRHRGLLFEDKIVSLALHYRRAPHLASYAHRLLQKLNAKIGPGFTVQTGKRVVELKPAGRHKGMAVVEFMEEKPFLSRTPVFVGDDDADEYGFVIINKMRGISIKVGPGKTAANYRLNDVRAVRAWLQKGLIAAGAVGTTLHSTQ